jgi:hypothetical protein
LRIHLSLVFHFEQSQGSNGSVQDTRMKANTRVQNMFRRIDAQPVFIIILQIAYPNAKTAQSPPAKPVVNEHNEPCSYLLGCLASEIFKP